MVDLGSITCPSGEIVIIDAGYLNMWSGEGSPTEVDLHIEDTALAQGFADAVDFEIEGPDAAEAAAAFGRQPWGPYLYDIPSHGVDSTRQDFADLCAASGLRAGLKAIDRVPHRERVRRAVERGGGCFMIMGVPLVAAPVSPVRPLPVVGVKVDFGGRVGEQWSVLAVTSDGEAVSSTRELGDVGVDYARILIVDGDALSSWQHDLPLDGKADVVFWGADVDRAREAVNADAVEGEPSIYGWTDVDIRDAIDRAQALEEWVATSQARLATDFRPHSHHWVGLQAAKASEHDVGFFDVDGARAALAFTGWGDGIFPVLGDVNTRDELVRVRIVLGDDEWAHRMEVYDCWAEGEPG
jgi:hypothetical protein